MNPSFQFKQFSVEQDQCAMKIGTDGVLLGAWAAVNNEIQSVLDIGAGTGILALMLAQRSQAEIIDALEIDDKAYEQCVSNFERSPWGDRLFCYHASLDEFSDEIDDTYDLIISNPPFYQDHHKSGDLKRNLARFQDAMPFDHLIQCASKLLSPTGRFTVVIPYSEQDNFKSIALTNGLYMNKILHVKGTTTSQIKRSLIDLSFQESETQINELIIETTRHQYTKDYIELTREYYLKM